METDFRQILLTVLDTLARVFTANSQINAQRFERATRDSDRVVYQEHYLRAEVCAAAATALSGSLRKIIASQEGEDVNIR